MRCLQKIVVIAVFALSLSAMLIAQGGATGAISGTLQDAHGRVLAGAKVEVISEATGLTVRALGSDASGGFNVLLPAANYSIAVEAEGFARRGLPELQCGSRKLPVCPRC